MSDMFLGSQTPMYQNVCIRRRNKNGKILEERHAKNRVTRLMLYGIGKFLLGHFNDSTPDKIYEFIPRYLALGTNTPGNDASTAGVSNISTVNDTRLLNEITQASTTGRTEPVKRIWIAERNMCKLNTKFSDPFIKVSIKTYVSSAQYDGMSIGEAGLFSKEQSNNCLARVCFSPIIKNPNEVLDIQWDITLLSYGETKYADSLELENGDSLTIPLKYTNKKFKEINLGLKKRWTDNAICFNNGTDEIELFEIKDNYIQQYEKISEDNSILIDKDYVKNKSGWYEYLDKQGISNLFDILYDNLLGLKLNESNCLVKEIKNNEIQYTMFYFGNLYNNQYIETIPEDTLSACLLFSEDTIKNYTLLQATYVRLNNDNDYSITTSDGLDDVYKVEKTRIYRKSLTEWVATDYFMYDGYIIDIHQNKTQYTYSGGSFNTVEIENVETFCNQYLTYDFSNYNNEEYYRIHNVNHVNESDYLFTETNYFIDLANTSKIFVYGLDADTNLYAFEDIGYHLTNDLYWVMSDYVKLIPIISPTNVTDKSITWAIQNSNIATINWDGVVTSKNLGETMTIATTSNDLRAKCLIKVVKDSNYIDVEEITLDPTEAELVVNGNINQFVIITANVFPLFATDTNVQWSTSYELNECVKLIDLGNNQVKVILNESGNMGSGYIIATSPSGVSANCLLRIVYRDDSITGNCDDPSHLN